MTFAGQQCEIWRGRGFRKRWLWRSLVTKTRSVFDRYNIVNDADLEVAAGRLQEYINREKVTLSVTLAELTGRASEASVEEVTEILEEKLVPPIRIERTTNGLGKRCHHPTPAYSGSFRPILAKS